MRLVQAVGRWLREVRQSQHRMTVLASAPDRWLPGAGAAPATYAEFLYRTSGPLLREPSAAMRARGQLTGLTTVC